MRFVRVDSQPPPFFIFLATALLSAAEGQHIAQMTIGTLKSLCSDDSFDLFWQKVNSNASELDISEPALTRHRRLPRRFDGGLSAGEFHDNPKAFYK